MAVYVGGFSPHKNLEALVAAFARIAARQEFADVAAGDGGRYVRAMRFTPVLEHRCAGGMRWGLAIG